MTSQSTVIPFSPELARSNAGGRVEPFAYVRLMKAESDRLTEVQRFRRRIAGVIEAVNRIDHFLSCARVEHARAHEKHKVEYALSGHRGLMPPWAYWFAICLIAALEIPLNVNALQEMRLDNVETLGVAACIALLNALGASLLGAQLRHSLPASRWKDFTVLIALTAAIGLSVLGLNQLREAFLASSVALRTGAMSSPMNSPLAFITLQTLFFAVAGALSYFARSERCELYAVLGDKAVYGKKLYRLWRQRGRLAAKFNLELAVAQARIQQREFRAMREIAEYRYENGRLRTDTVPTFLQEPVLRSFFQPLELGKPIDHNPQRIDLVHSGGTE